MYAKRMVVCAMMALALLLGMSIAGSIPKVSAKECYRAESCGHPCYYFPELGLYYECREVYKKAVRDDECGIGLRSSTPCGSLYIGTTQCDTATGTTCGDDSYTNGEC